MPPTVAVIVGTRPELIKMAPVFDALRATRTPFRFIHTGQHYDENMSAAFVRDLGLPRVDAFLGVGSGSQARQTAEAMKRIEAELEEKPCQVVLVQGDTNTVLAGALVGAKMGIRIGHVEAGLRSFDRRMPEEHNRIVADHLSTQLFAPTKAAARRLAQEHVTGRIHMTGNTVLDVIRRLAPRAATRARIEVPDEPFALVTAHRAENVDDPRVLAQLVSAICRLPIATVYPVHPRTRKLLQATGLWRRLVSAPAVTVTEPLGYFDFLHLMQQCRLILTDSGGIQEEATAPEVRKRVFVLRRSTERPEAIKAGFATLVGTQGKDILAAVARELRQPRRLTRRSPYGDGNAGRRIVALVRAAFG